MARHPKIVHEALEAKLRKVDSLIATTDWDYADAHAALDEHREVILDKMRVLAAGGQAALQSLCQLLKGPMG